jgi:TonB family protein
LTLPRARSRLPRMKRHLCPVLFFASLSGFFPFLQIAVAQTVSSTEAPQAQVALVKLAPLRYPPLPLQARITGDVRVNVHVRPDGGVASAEALSGHPMLAPAAVENARQSQYQCNGCTGETEYVLTYTFGFIEDLKQYDKFEDRPARAGRCLYLWKCGLVRVNRFDSCSAVVPPEITQSPGRVKILEFPACLETMYSASASR